jgi:hypothetical protein
MADTYAQVFRLFHAVRRPHRGEQSAVRKDLLRMSCEVDQKIELLWGKADFLILHFHESAWSIDVEIANIDNGRFWLLGR